MKNKTNTIHGHEYPKYHGYKGGFDNVTECDSCGNIALYEDAHPVNPCRHCGGKVIEGKVARFVYPAYSGCLWWKEVVALGFWEFAKRTQP